MALIFNCQFSGSCKGEPPQLRASANVVFGRAKSINI